MIDDDDDDDPNLNEFTTPNIIYISNYTFNASMFRYE